MMGTAVTELGNLNELGVTVSQHGRSQMMALTRQRQGGVVTVMDNKVKAAVRIV